MTAKAKKKGGTGRPFTIGTSGNPAGRPVGSRNKATLAAEQLLDGRAERLTEKAIELALGGDVTALRLCLERVIGPRRDRPIQLKLPSATKAQEIPAALAAAIQAVGEGRITPAEGQILAEMLEAHRKVLETAELEARVSELEKALEDRQNHPRSGDAPPSRGGLQ